MANLLVSPRRQTLEGENIVTAHALALGGNITQLRNVLDRVLRGDGFLDRESFSAAVHGAEVHRDALYHQLELMAGATRIKLAMRNRQIRDLRRQLRK